VCPRRFTPFGLARLSLGISRHLTVTGVKGIGDRVGVIYPTAGVLP